MAANKALHFDSKKIFNPVLINNVCDIFDHHIKNHLSEQIILNMGVNKKTTYYQFMLDVADSLKLDKSLIQEDGDEPGWPQDSSLNVEKIGRLGYPQLT